MRRRRDTSSLANSSVSSIPTELCSFYEYLLATDARSTFGMRERESHLDRHDSRDDLSAGPLQGRPVNFPRVFVGPHRYLNPLPRVLPNELVKRPQFLV